MMKKLTIVVLLFVLGGTLWAQNGPLDSPYDVAPITAVTSPDSTPPANWPFPTAFNWNYAAIGSPGVNAGTVGAMYFNNKYYLNRWNSTVLYRYNGGLYGPTTFSDSGTYTGSIRDLATDGQYLYGGKATAVIYQMDSTGAVVSQITCPTGTAVRALAYSPVEDVFFTSNFSDDIRVISRTGALVRTLSGTAAIAAKYGMAFSNINGEQALWVWGQGTSTDPYNTLTKVNPQTGAVLATYRFGPYPVSGTSHLGIAGGAEVCKIGNNFVLLLNHQNYALSGYVIGSDISYPLNPFNLVSPPAGTTVVGKPLDTTKVTVTWDTSATGAVYKWIFGQPGNPRIVELPSGTNSLVMTLAQVDALLASNGLQPGDSVVGQWDVWAYRVLPGGGMDSLKSTNGPRAITLKRYKPILSPFNLANPPNGTTVVTSAFNATPINFNWTSSGSAIQYKWKFGTTLNKNNDLLPLIVLPSNGLGFDTALTVINSALDAMLSGLGVMPGDSIVGQWAVWAYSGSDSLKSAQTYNITFKRQAKGDYLLVYDSTSTNGRIGRDTAVAVLGRIGVSYDLFNKGGITSTNVISFRGYKTVIWCATATSTFSAVQRDSMKAYLNSGSANGKSKLIVFGEDIGYQHGRSGSTYLDLDFLNNYLGANYVLDRPSSGANQRLIGLQPGFNLGETDSTVGTWPDVLSVFSPGGTWALWSYTDPAQLNSIGKVAGTFNTVLIASDIHALRRAHDSGPLSSAEHMMRRAIQFVTFDGIIPVELTSFTATANGNTVSLNWSTATEQNNKGFEVERRVEGGSFVSIAFIEGKGTTTEKQNYSFVDRVQTTGKVEYRLKQVDFDGKSEYSNIVEVEVELPKEFSLSQNYPNPFNPTTAIEFSLIADSKVTLRLYDALGQEVKTLINASMTAGVHRYDLNASGFMSGVYFYTLEAVSANGERFSATKKMILMK